MARPKVDRYINNAYSRWLEYATYHCKLAGLEGHECDVLNEAIADIITKKTDDQLTDLLEQKKDRYTGLDAFVLKVVNRYAHFERANYRWRYLKERHDGNADVNLIGDTMADEPGKQEPELVVDPQGLIEIVHGSDLSPLAKQVFDWKFTQRKKLKDFQGTQPRKLIYQTYSKTIEYLLHLFDKPTRRERKMGVMQLTLKI